MQKLKSVTDSKEAQTIQKILYNASIPCYIREASGEFIIEVSPDDVTKAEMLLSLPMPIAEPMPAPNLSQSERPLQEAQAPVQSKLEKASADELSEHLPTTQPSPESLSCLRCYMELEFVGAETLQTWGWLGLQGAHDLVLYSCPSCGHLEFFSPESPWATSSRAKVLSSWEKAESLVSRGQLDQAIKVYEEIIRKHPVMLSGRDAQAAIKDLQERLHQTIFYTAQSEHEARIIQKLLIGACIDCYCTALSSEAYELRVSKEMVETARALVHSSRIEVDLASCPRCQVPLDYLEEREIPLGLQVGSLNTHTAKVGLYLCPQCYQFFFLDGQKQTIDLSIDPETSYDYLSRIAAEYIDKNKLKGAINLYSHIVRDFPNYAHEAMRCIRVLNERLAKGR
jgi:uncharacterized protein with PIN domain